MTRLGLLVASGAALGIVAASYARANLGQATPANEAQAYASDSAEPASGPATTNPGDTWTDAAASAIDAINPWAIMQGNAAAQSASDANVSAFLTAIARSEGTDRSPDPYRVCYAYKHTVQDMGGHPADTKRAGGAEWRGESLNSLGPRYAGKVSTAAGRYQIILPTWRGCARALSLGDFSPASQDAAAVYLIDSAGGLDAVKAGDLGTAAAMCANLWASLPTSTAGQGKRSQAQFAAYFEQAGGVLA